MNLALLIFLYLVIVGMYINVAETLLFLIVLGFIYLIFRYLI